MLLVGACRYLMKTRDYYIKCDKGFTLMELLVSLAIMSIVLGAIFSFYIFNYNNFIREEENAEIQYQLQMAMGDIIENVIYSEGIYGTPTTEGINKIKKIIFHRQGTNGTEYYIIEHDSDELLYLETESDAPEHEHATNKLADYIGYLKMTPTAGDYGTSSGIEIEIKGVKGNSELIINNIVYFRNAE